VVVAEGAHGTAGAARGIAQEDRRRDVVAARDGEHRRCVAVHRHPEHEHGWCHLVHRCVVGAAVDGDRHVVALHDRLAALTVTTAGFSAEHGSAGRPSVTGGAVDGVEAPP
jgi:hypothetical protein